MFVIKDSVIDMTNPYAQHKPIQPRLISTPGTHSVSFQTKQDRQKLDGSYECTPRARRSTSCPSYRRNSDRHPGPAIPLQAYRRIPDPRESSLAKQSRINNLGGPPRSHRRHTITNRTNTRPKNPNPGLAIAEIKTFMLTA